MPPTAHNHPNVPQVENGASSHALPGRSNVTEGKHCFEEGRRIKGLLFVLVVLFASCSGTKTKSHGDGYSEYIISDVTECLVDTLFSHNDTEIISSVEVRITGYVDGSAIIKFENGAGRFDEVYLTDSVRYVYENEWYDKGLVFIYTPHEDVSMGNIRLEYKF